MSQQKRFLKLETSPAEKADELKRRKHAETARQSRVDRKLGFKELRGCKIDEVNHVELLIAHKLLTEAEAEDWLAVGKATAVLLERMGLVHLRRIS